MPRKSLARLAAEWVTHSASLTARWRTCATRFSPGTPARRTTSNTRLNNGSMRWCSPSRKVVHRTGNRWSIGTNWKIIEAGDMVCMFRQGVHGRDIVATGVITRGAFRDSHWNPDKTGDAWYVNVAWNRALDLNQMITIDELAREVPGFAWTKAYSSGRTVDGSPAEHLASLRLASRGQGRRREGLHVPQPAALLHLAADPPRRVGQDRPSSPWARQRRRDSRHLQPPVARLGRPDARGR